jgi:divalent metal cation (Fe/Co/Zn/Cd) transporter
MPLRPQKLVLLSLLVSTVALVGCAVAALTSQSFTIRADLLNAFLELSGDIVVLVAMRMASNGRWAALDYGPGKIENFGGLLVGMVMFLGLAGLGLQLAHAFYNPEPVSGVGIRTGLFVAMASCLVDAWIWWQVRQENRRSPSPLLDAFGRTNLNAALVGAMTCFTLSASLVSRAAWVTYLDIFTAAGLGLFAAHHALQMVRHFDNYLTFDSVRSRCAGSTVFIDIFLGFAPQQSIREIQTTVDKLRAGLERDIPSARVTVISRSHEAGDTTA